MTCVTACHWERGERKRERERNGFEYEFNNSGLEQTADSFYHIIWINFNMKNVPVDINWINNSSNPVLSTSNCNQVNSISFKLCEIVILISIKTEIWLDYIFHMALWAISELLKTMLQLPYYTTNSKAFTHVEFVNKSMCIENSWKWNWILYLYKIYSINVWI